MSVWTRCRLVALLPLTLALVSVPAEALSPANAYFAANWARYDLPVSTGAIQRTWMWGPEAFTAALPEAYDESPDHVRYVQYFDKARMEITHPDGDSSSIWYVTNGLLPRELITGRMQLGDNHFVPYAPAQENVAGDPDDPSGPTYASFGALLDATALPVGTTIIQRVSRDGQVTHDSSLTSRGVTIAYIDGATKHAVATPFATGIAADLTARGLPLTEPYWANVKVAGTRRDVLMQCFERRCLTYTPGNPEGWQVEAGNVGRHYYAWRYRAQPEPTYPAFGVQESHVLWQGAENPLERTANAVNRAADAGLRYLRFDIEWQHAEPNRGQWNEGYLGRLDQVLVLMEARGIQPIAILQTAPKWAQGQRGSGCSAGDHEWAIPPRDPAEYAAAATYLAARYAGRIDVWEIWNEPNICDFWNAHGGPNAADYTALLRAAYPAIKLVNPNAIVLGGALSENDVEFLDAMYDAGAAGFFDALSIHPYNNANDPDWLVPGQERHSFVAVPQVKRAMEEHGDADTPIWITEMGWSTAHGVGDATRADYFSRAVELVRSWPYVQVFIAFRFDDDGEQASGFELWIGGAPTQTWNAYVAAAAGTYSHQPEPGNCHATNEQGSLLEGRAALATGAGSDRYLHVEFYVAGEPEREAVLNAGSYRIVNSPLGRFWEYVDCTREEVVALVDEHIARRINEGANNAGWAAQALIDAFFQRIE